MIQSNTATLMKEEKTERAASHLRAVRLQLSVAFLPSILLKTIFSGQDNKKGCLSGVA